MLLKHNLINLNLNNYVYVFNDICTIFQASMQKSLYLPRFCYHVKLKLAGNCRLCLVEDLALLKPVIACATLINNNANILTNSSLVFKAREGILEFLLINHPLDCPVCDQGGECDLQDQYTVMGNTTARYYEKLKKNNEEIGVSFILKLSLNKCINCSRCTRYVQDICGEYTFSLLGRGENLKISNYHDYRYLFSEIIGNMIDLCPVGAITLKNIAYSYRFWELLESKFIDLSDVLHSPIRIDFRGLNIIRILPIVDSFLQEEWINDATRFSFDFINNFKEKMCMIKKKFKIFSISWSNIFYVIKNYYNNLLYFFINKKFFFLNNFSFSQISCDAFQAEMYKNFFSKFSFFNINFFNNKIKSFFRISFVNNQIDLDFLKISFFLIFNLNLRSNLPVINFKVREKIKFDYNTVVYLGPLASSNIFFLHFGNSFKKFIDFFKKKNYNFSKENLLILKGKNINNSFNYFKFINILKFKQVFSVLNFVCKNSFEILTFEINLLYKNFNFMVNNFFNFFSLFYETDGGYKNNYFFNNDALKLSSDNNCNFVFFNANLPLISVLEKPVLFINIFGKVSDFTYSFYKYFTSNFKNDWSIIKIFSEIFFLKYFLKISFLQNKYIPKYWIKQHYYLKIFNFIYFESNLSLNINFYFFSDFINFSINADLINSFYLKTYNVILKKLNSLQNMIKINNIQWLF